MPRTEREKMLAGLAYNSRDAELMRLHARARELMARYNLQYYPRREDREAILGELLGSIGRGVWVEPPFYCDYGCHITLGDNTFINFNCVFLDCGTITVGRNVLIAPAVQVYAVTHPVLPEDRILPRFRQPQHLAPAPDENISVCRDVTAPVSIGDNVWIGGGSIILPGVAIGEGTTIGAGSVVTKDIPSGVVAHGNPCRVVRRL